MTIDIFETKKKKSLELQKSKRKFPITIHLEFKMTCKEEGKNRGFFYCNEIFKG